MHAIAILLPQIFAKRLRPVRPAKSDEEKGFVTAILFIVIVLVVAALVFLLFGSYTFPL
jgi:Sec-independent protein secretion pathway component TatC